MSRHPDDPTIVLTITIRDGGRVELWTRKGMPAIDLADMLEDMAKQFRTGTVSRVE